MKNIILAFILIFFTGCSGINKNADQNAAQPPKDAALPEKDNRNNMNSTILGAYSTKLLDKSKSRLKNINLAIEQVNKVVLSPGEAFSFNETVGPRLQSRGFQKARILIRKEKVMGYGGGICQLSTTIYNSALGAGLEIVERHEHENEIGYVRLGDDATVSYPDLDLKIKNNKDVPIKIQSEISENEVTVKIVTAGE